MSNYQPQQPGQPQPYQTAPPQPKRSKALGCLIFAGIVGLLLVVLIIVIAVAAGGGKDDNPNGNTGKVEASTSAVPKDRGEPRPVQVGKAFTIGKHRLDAGWTLEFQDYLGTTVTGTVTNVSEETSTAVFHIKFLKGSTVVGNMQCITNDLEAGQQESVSCLNMVQGSANLKVKGAYDRVTAEATF